MPNFAWYLIDSGDRFQDLVGCLLLQEVSKHVAPFTKPGRDYSIDASLAEGTYGGRTGSWRFQAKFYSDLSNLKSKLKNEEVPRILGHLGGKPGQKGFELWKGTTEYVLLTNITLLPQERLDVLTILAPLKSHGINVDVWDGAKIEQLCNGHPFVMEQFFGEDAPLFVPAAEFLRQRARQPLGEFYQTLPYLGRSELEATVTSFLTGPHTVLRVRGTGGIGKTRTLVELAKSHDDDTAYRLWFVQHEAAHFEAHSRGLDPRLRHVVVVDDADRFVHLERLLTFVTTHRQMGGRVKLVLAYRGAVAEGIDPLILAKVERGRIGDIELKKIPDELDKIAAVLGHTGREADAVIALADGIPLWVVLASEAVKAGVSLQSLTRENLAGAYIQRYLNEVAPEARPLHREFLSLLSALEPVNIADASARDKLAALLGQPNPRVMEALSHILRSGIIERRGRFIRISPDVVSDYVLKQAMVIDGGIPTDLHRELMKKDVPDTRRLISNLTRAEYLTGVQLLDGAVQELPVVVPSLANDQRLALLYNFEALAYAHPGGFLAIAEAILDTSGEWNVADEQGVSAAEVVIQLCATMAGPLREPAQVPRAMEILGRIVSHADCSPPVRNAAGEVLRASVRYSSLTRFGAQQQALALCRGWWEQGSLERLSLIHVVIAELLRLEVEETRTRGITLTWATFRLPANAFVRELRAGARALLRSTLESQVVPTRLASARVLKDAIGEILRTTSDEKERTFVTGGGGEDGSEPVAHTIPITPVSDGDEAYLETELDAFFELVEERARAESDVQVLDALEACVEWHRMFAPETPHGKRAVVIRHQLQKHDDYRRDAAITGTRHDVAEDEAEQAWVIEDALSRKPEEFLGILREIVERRADTLFGSARMILQRVSMRAPEYGRALLALLGDGVPSLHPFYVGGILAGIHLSSEPGTLLVDTAKRGGLWRQAVADACGSLRKAWHPGFTPDPAHIALLRELATDPEPAVHAAIALKLWLIADAAPAEVLAVAETLLIHGERHVESVAQVCREALKLDPSLRPQVEKLVERFVAIQNLDAHWATDVLGTLSKDDPCWLVDFMERRVRYVEENRLDWRSRSMIPEGMARTVLPKIANHPGRAAAIDRVLGWCRSSERLSRAASRMIKAYSAEILDDLTVNRIRDAIASAQSTEEIKRLADVLAVFKDDERKTELIGECLVRLTALSGADVRDAVNALHSAFGRGGYSGIPGKVPPALSKRLQLLQELDQKMSGVALAQEFVANASAAVRAQIEAGLRMDEELGIR